MQPVSACFAIDHLAGEDHTIPRPALYEAFRDARPPGFPDGQLSLIAPDPRTNAPIPRTLRPNPPGDPALVGPDLERPRTGPRPVAVPAHRRSPQLRSPAAQRHHARELAADGLPRRPRVRHARGRPPRAGRPPAEPQPPVLAPDRGRASPGCGCAATSPATRRTGSRRRSTSASHGASRASTPSSSRTSPMPSAASTARSSTRTPSGSAPTGSTCTPPRAATPTSTSRAARSRSRSAR